MELTVLGKKDELVERCNEGESLAFIALYHRYCKTMYNDAGAEDVLEENFIEAFKNPHAFEYRSSFGGEQRSYTYQGIK